MIPLELITATVGLAIGAWSKIKERNDETMRIAIQGDKVRVADTQNAREYSRFLPNVQWTKRMLAFMLCGTWSALHLGIDIPAMLDLTSSVTIGYTEVTPKFLFWGGEEAVKWKTVAGTAITPAFSNVVVLIVSYYFGSGGSKR